MIDGNGNSKNCRQTFFLRGAVERERENALEIGLLKGKII